MFILGTVRAVKAVVQSMSNKKMESFMYKNQERSQLRKREVSLKIIDQFNFNKKIQIFPFLKETKFELNNGVV